MAAGHDEVHKEEVLHSANFKYDIYLSFAPENLNFAKSAYRKFISHGLSVCFIEESEKENRDMQYIEHHLAQSKCFVYICTPVSLRSMYVKHEYKQFYNAYYRNTPGERYYFILRGPGFIFFKVPNILHELETDSSAENIIKKLEQTGEFHITHSKNNSNNNHSHKPKKHKTESKKAKIIKVILLAIFVLSIVYFITDKPGERDNSYAQTTKNYNVSPSSDNGIKEEEQLVKTPKKKEKQPEVKKRPKKNVRVDKEKQLWETALKMNTIDYYQYYIQDYPNGKYTKDAYAKINELKKDSDNLPDIAPAETIQIFLMQISKGDLKGAFEKVDGGRWPEFSKLNKEFRFLFLQKIKINFCDILTSDANQAWVYVDYTYGSNPKKHKREKYYLKLKKSAWQIANYETLEAF